MSILHKLFSIRPRRQLRELYLFSIMFSFASSLILIFEPVFFYKEGIGLHLISLYYAIHYTLYLFVMPLGAKFAARFGLERSLSIAMPLFVIYFLALASIPRVPELFWIAWILLTLFKIFYWPAYHAAVAKFGDGSNRGTELSWLFALTRGIGVLGPLFGGIIATQFGFPVLFVLAAALAFVATLPLLRTKERFRVQRFDYGEPWRMMLSRQHRRTWRAMLGWGENYVDLVFWPIFMFIILGGADTLGYVASFNILLMTVIGFFIGEISDRFPRRQILRLHIPFLVMSYLFRPLAASPVRLLLTDSLAKASFIGVRLPMWYQVYVRSNQTSVLRFVVTLEMVLSIAKALTAWVLVAVFAFTAPYIGFSVAFVLAALISLLYISL